jgi:hypothetical protein
MCYKFVRNDYDVISYEDENHKAQPVIFEKNDFKVMVKYLGTNPFIPNHMTMGVDPKLLKHLQTYIEIENFRRDAKNLTPPEKATLIDCKVILKDDKNNTIPYQSVEVVPNKGLPIGKKTITYNTENDLIVTKPILDKQSFFLIYYLYKGFLEEITTAQIEIKLTILLEGKIYKIEKSAELKRKKSTETRWGPFI